MRRTASLSIALGCVLAASGARAEQNALMGFGMVGPAQFDQGDVKLMATANVTGLFHIGDSISVGGIGVAVRATYGLDRLFAHDNFDELGLALPFVTLRRGRAVVQFGAEIQRANFHKYLYYSAIGLGFGGRNKPRPVPPGGPRPLADHVNRQNDGNGHAGVHVDLKDSAVAGSRR
jgi:hypothetical protein